MIKLKISPIYIVLGILIIFLYLFLRLINLNHIPVFVDEAIYIRWAQIMQHEQTLRFLPLSDGKQPLFMWITIPFFKLISDPLIAGRTVSVFAGLGSLLGVSSLTYLLTKKINTSFLAGLIYTITPFFVFFDRMSLVDSLLAMFGIWSIFFGVLFVKTCRLDVAMTLGFVLGGGLLTKSPAIFFYIWQALIFILFVKISKNKLLRGEWFKYIPGYAAAVVISQGLYNILRLGPNFQLVGARNADYLYSFAEVLTHPTFPLFYNLGNTFSWLWTLLTPIILIAVFAALFTRYKKIALSFIILSITPLIAQSLIAKVYTPRYILFATLPLIIPATLSVKSLLGQRSILRGWIFLAILLLFPLYQSLTYVFTPTTAWMPERMRNGYFEEWTAGWGQKEVGAYLADQASQGKKIVVGTEGYFGTLPDGLQIYTQDYPQITVIGIGLAIESVPEPLINSLTDPQNDIYLVVNKSRNKMEVDNKSELDKLEKIAEYSKTPRPDGSQEVLQFYKLKRS
jgi:4-amino-4-deoxy-L-arabinose transferase-like glycosyltransferase